MESVDYNNFIFLDLETTSLPALEYDGKTKIMELCLVAVQSKHLTRGITPRVQHKLTLCFNPGRLVSDGAEYKTGLSNFVLEKLGFFSKSTVEAINLFLDHQPKPICLVAHNGNRFDFPILRAEINGTGVPLMSGIYCVDSMDIFKYVYWSELETDNKGKNSEETNETKRKRRPDSENQAKKMRGETWRSALQYSSIFKLEDVYTRLTQSEPVASHSAEGDTVMLLTAALKLGNKFVEQAKMHSEKFEDIPPMTPGGRIASCSVKQILSG